MKKKLQSMFDVYSAKYREAVICNRVKFIQREFVAKIFSTEFILIILLV